MSHPKKQKKSRKKRRKAQTRANELAVQEKMPLLGWILCSEKKEEAFARGKGTASKLPSSFEKDGGKFFACLQ